MTPVQNSSNLLLSMTTYQILLAVLTLGLSSTFSPAAVILTVEENGTGGVTVTASGSIDTSLFSDATHSDFTFAESGVQAWTGLRFWAYLDGTNVQENWDWSGTGRFAGEGPSGSITYDSINLGTFGRGFWFDDDDFTVVGDGATDDDIEPITIYDFDFVLTDNDGTLSQYTDGLVLWDSNGTDAGGETVTMTVVPEPSSALLLGLTALGIATLRRQKK